MQSELTQIEFYFPTNNKGGITSKEKLADLIVDKMRKKEAPSTPGFMKKSY